MKKEEFKQQKELIELKRKAELEVEKFRHENSLQEIKAEREAKMEIQRIRSAEIRKSQLRQMENRI